MKLKVTKIFYEPGVWIKIIQAHIDAGLVKKIST